MWQRIAIAAALAGLAIGSWAGWSARDSLCDAAALRKANAELAAEVELLRKDAALKNTLQAELDRQKETIDALNTAYQASIAKGDCPATRGDVEHFRRLLR